MLHLCIPYTYCTITIKFICDGTSATTDKGGAANVIEIGKKRLFPTGSLESHLQRNGCSKSKYSKDGLTVRGTYVPTGKNPPEGERKLYLAIESYSELAVQKAKREITRLIKEELLKLSSAHRFQ